MDLLIEKGDKRTYLSRYKVITTSFEESSPSVKRNNTQIQYRNGNVDFGGWNESKTIDYVGYYRADDLEDEEYLRERIYALLSDPEGYYITQLKNDNDNSFERPGEASGDYFDKQVNRPSHKRFYVYASSLESELVGSYGGHVLYKISATFTTMKLPYGESVTRDLDVTPNMPYYGQNLLINTSSSSTNGRTQIPGAVPSVGGVNKYSRTDSYEQVTDAGNVEFYYRFMSPSITNLYGLTPGGTYTLSGSASHTSGELKFRAEYGAGGGYHKLGDPSDLGIPVSDGSVFTPFSYTFTIPVGATGIYISLQNDDYTAGGLFRFKNMKLEKGSVATPWSPAPSDPEYNAWYTKIYYNTKKLVIPYAGTVPCSQLEQEFAVEFTAKEAGSSIVIDVNGTELTYSGQVYSGDVIKLSGYEYTKNNISIVKYTNKAYFKLIPGIANTISSNLHGSIKILGYQDLYA